MSDINWKDGAVCYASGKQWFSHVLNTLMDSFDYTETTKIVPLNWLVKQSDFQLNEIRTGDYIPTSELDTEQKYNEVVESLKLHGVTGGLVEDKYSYQDIVGMFSDDKFIAIHNVENEVCAGFVNDGSFCNRKMFFDQIIAIGKLKRMMLELERSKGGYINEIPIPDNTSEFDAIVSSKSVGMSEYFSDRVSTAKALNIEINGKPVKPKRRNKSKQAYDILKSLDYEYDLVKQKWFKKQYID